MCIRDSAHTVNAPRVRAIWRVAAGLARDSDRALHDHAAKSVSYTHLRAHETVLDLVCRLLLEKKKSTRSTASHISYQPHRANITQSPTAEHLI